MLNKHLVSGNNVGAWCCETIILVVAAFSGTMYKRSLVKSMFYSMMINDKSSEII